MYGGFGIMSSKKNHFICESAKIFDLIARRRRQILVHSILYYRMNENIIPDSKWSEWAMELEELQSRYPEIANRAVFAEEFKGFDHSTGQNLPLDNEWGITTALRLLDYCSENDYSIACTL